LKKGIRYYSYLLVGMSLGQEILNALNSIRSDIKSYAESRQYYLIPYDTEPDLIPRFPALAYFVSAISASPAALNLGGSYEFTATIILYKKLPLSEDSQLDDEVSDVINYFVAKGYEVSSVGMEDTSAGTSLLRRAEILIKLPKLLK